MEKSLWGKLFPFIPLLSGLGYINYHRIYGTPDAQDALGYAYVLIISLQGMLAFTVAGLMYLAKKQKELRYHQTLFIILAAINLITLIVLLLFGVWVQAILMLVLLFWGVRSLNYKPFKFY